MRMRPRSVEVEISLGETFSAGGFVVRLEELGTQHVILIVDLPPGASLPSAESFGRQDQPVAAESFIRQEQKIEPRVEAEAATSESEVVYRTVDYARDALTQLGNWSHVQDLILEMEKLGWTTTAQDKNKADSVRSSLRYDGGRTLVSISGNRWGLKDWKQPKDSEPWTRRSPRPSSLQPATSKPISIRSLVLRFVRDHSQFTMADVVKWVKSKRHDAKSSTVQSELTYAVQRGDIERTEPGVYLSLVSEQREPPDVGDEDGRQEAAGDKHPVGDLFRGSYVNSPGEQ